MNSSDERPVSLTLEQAYLAIRQKEGRLLPDQYVTMLPDLPENHPLRREWVWRKRSFRRLQDYLHTQFKTRATILDLGCGNGWLANRLAEHPDWKVTAVDVNELELLQGQRLFERDNLRFELLRNTEPIPLSQQISGPFDIVLLAASVQYFPNLEPLISALRSLLSPGGEIHLIDSPFYAGESARQAARQRSVQYFEKLETPEMIPFYHHHLMETVLRLGGENLNGSPGIRLLQITGWLPPFPWIRFKK